MKARKNNQSTNLIKNMTIRIQIINDKITTEVRQRIRRRIAHFSQFNDRILRATAILKKDGNSISKGCHCEIRLMIKGNDLFAKNRSDTFENASSLVVESLRRQLLRLKTKKEKQRRKNKLLKHD